MYDLKPFMIHQTYEEELDELMYQVNEEIDLRDQASKLDDIDAIGASLYFTGAELRIIANLIEAARREGAHE